MNAAEARITAMMLEQVGYRFDFDRDAHAWTWTRTADRIARGPFNSFEAAVNDALDYGASDQRTPRKYYAIYRPYGRSTMSKCDTLYRFERRADRDETVNGETFDGQNYHWRAITRNEARAYFPAAFRADAWTGEPAAWIKDGDRDRYDGAPTGGEYAYMS